MKFRALLLPALCTLIFLSGCQPSESPEYKQALADFDKHTVKLIDKQFEIYALLNAKDTEKATTETASLEGISKESDLVIQRINGLRPTKPDAKLYAQAMKDQEEIQAVLKDLNFRIRQNKEDLETLKSLTLEAERKKYDAIERSLIHQP